MKRFALVAVILITTILLGCSPKASVTSPPTQVTTPPATTETPASNATTPIVPTPASPSTPSSPSPAPPQETKSSQGVEFNLVEHAGWEYIDPNIQVTNGRIIVSSGNSSWLIALNEGLRFKIQGNWSVLSSLQISNAGGAGIMLVGSLGQGPGQGLNSLGVVVATDSVNVNIRTGESSALAFSRAFRVDGLGAKADIEVKRIGSELVIVVNTVTIGVVNDLGIFDSGDLYPGVLSAPGNTLIIERLAIQAPSGQEDNVQFYQPVFSGTHSSIKTLRPTPNRPASLALPSQEMVLNTLSPVHPRLIFLDEDIDELKKTITRDPVARIYYLRLQRAAEQSLAEPVILRENLVGTLHGTAIQRMVKRVYTLALLYRLDGDQRWAVRASKEMLAAARFVDWNPDDDLDIAEMSNAMAIVYDWLYDTLSTNDREEIRQAIVNKGLRPALQAYRSKAWWTQVNMNHNPVSNGGAAIAALAVADTDPDISREVLAIALANIPYGLVPYAPDGAGWEGPGYWEFGTRYLILTIAALESSLGTDFGLGSSLGLSKTGLYRVNVVGPTGALFNNDDSGPNEAWNGDDPSLFWLSRRYGQPLLAWAGREAAVGRLGQATSVSALDLMWYDSSGSLDDLKRNPLDVFYQGDKAIALLRSAWADKEALFVGFKGGNNKVIHAHLDQGTFVFDAMGQRWALDLGSDTYELPGYFGSLRWTYYRLNTQGHNTLTFNGQNQDPKAIARLVAVGSTPDTAFAVADLTAAYVVSGSKRVQRGIALVDNRSRMIVQDEIELTRPADIVWAMHTRAEIDIQGNRAVLTQGGAKLEIQLVPPQEAHFEVQPVILSPPQIPAPGVKKLLIRLPQAASVATITVLFTPGGNKAPVSVAPLDSWPTFGPIKP